MKKILIAVVLVIVIAGTIYTRYRNDVYKPNTQVSANAVTADEAMNATYTIEGRSIAFTDGKSSVEAAPGSAEKVETLIFGEPVFGDVNGDGETDAAAFITQSAGGTGVFYYVAVVTRGPSGVEGSNAIFLGDRIAPQNIRIVDNKVVVNYADRKPDEPFTAAPSVGVSKYLILIDSELREVAQ